MHSASRGDRPPRGARQPGARDRSGHVNKLIAKVAPTINFSTPFKPRVACACPDTSGNQIPGVLSQSGGVVSCFLLGFDAAGALDAISLCENYVVLGH